MISQRDIVTASLLADNQRQSHHGTYRKRPAPARSGGYVQDTDGHWHATRSPLGSELARIVETLRQPVELTEDDCTCHGEGPDFFGNYDRVENPSCPLHALARRAA